MKITKEQKKFLEAGAKLLREKKLEKINWKK